MMCRGPRCGPRCIIEALVYALAVKKNALPIVLFFGLLVGCGAIVFASNTAIFQKTDAASQLDRQIASAQAEVAAHPPIAQPYISLASSYLQKARETADSSYYDKMDEALAQAQKIDASDADVPALQAAALNGRHEFEAAYASAKKAIAMNDTKPAYFGLLGDSAIELGKYDEAAAAFQKMIDMRPDFNSWSRVAYIRELYGDIAGAKAALRESITSGSEYQENIAWAYVELGKLDMRDNLDAAHKDFTDALTVLPTYSQAHEGLGKVAFARGERATAETEFMDAYNLLPLAQYATDLAQLYKAEGNTQRANQYLALTAAAYKDSKKSGVDTDLEQSLFESDNNVDLADSLVRAERAYRDRPNEYAADYLAWALYKNGKVAEAASYAPKALQLGGVDPLILYHQGMIALAGGDKAHAKQYLQKSAALSPNLFLYSLDQDASRKQAIESLQ